MVAALHYRDEKTNGGELSKLVAKVRGKSDETVEVEVVWGRLNRGQESQTKKEVKVELNRTGLDFKREEIGTNGLYVLGKGQVESVEQLPDELAKEISDYYRSLVDAKQRGK